MLGLKSERTLTGFVGPARWKLCRHKSDAFHLHTLYYSDILTCLSLFFFLPFACDKVLIKDFPSLPLRPGSTLNYHPGEGLRGVFMSVVLKLEDAFYHCTLSESFVSGCFLLMVGFGCFDVPSFYCLLQSVAQRVSLCP